MAKKRGIRREKERERERERGRGDGRATPKVRHELWMLRTTGRARAETRALET